MEYHTWKERTDDGTLLYRAGHHASRWTLEYCPKVGRRNRDDVDWEPAEFTREHWQTLRDILWRKYQRKRCPWELVEQIDKTLDELENGDDEAPAPGSEAPGRPNAR